MCAQPTRSLKVRRVRMQTSQQCETAKTLELGQCANVNNGDCGGGTRRGPRSPGPSSAPPLLCKALPGKQGLQRPSSQKLTMKMRWIRTWKRAQVDRPQRSLSDQGAAWLGFGMKLNSAHPERVSHLICETRMWRVTTAGL